jgi:ATP-dependent DNA helicase RecG
MQMRVADLIRDAELLPQVQQAAELMLAANEANIAPLLRRWTGQGEKFGKV